MLTEMTNRLSRSLFVRLSHPSALESPTARGVAAAVREFRFIAEKANIRSTA